MISMAKCHTICAKQKRPVRQRPKYSENINKNLTATIRTKYGNTRKSKIRESIRQGVILSVIEYANIIDEIAKEINTKNIGTTKIGITEIDGCLLWMDDVALIHTNKTEQQQKC